MESKVFDMEVKFEGSKVVAAGKVDPNKDGQHLIKMCIEIDLAEAPDEFLTLISKKKEA